MRILKVGLQNINSLKSATPIVIDFESDKFQDVGLFAITGATGAGKTTVLDAITIAMYHRVPRFNKPNVKASLEDVVSYGADGAMAAVVFENKGARYEAQWAIRLTAKNGKRLSHPREEVRIKNLSTEKILAEKKREAQTEIEKITQLNYDQFLRSVMLAQGEFASFLSANAKEKGTLLEQITGEEIYKKIGEAINRRISEERVKLEKIKAQINTEDLLSDEVREALLTEYEALSGKINTCNKDIKRFDSILNWFKQHDELDKEELQLEVKLAELERGKEGSQHIIKALDLHEKAEPYRDLLMEIVRLEKGIPQKKERTKDLTRQLERLHERLEEAQKREEKSKGHHSQKESGLKEWLPKLEQVAKFDERIINLREAVDKTTAAVKECDDDIYRFKKDLEEKEMACRQKENTLMEVEAFLLKQENVPEIDKRLNDWNSQLTIRKSNKKRISEEIALIKKAESDLAKTNHKIENATAGLKGEETKLAGVIAEISSILNDLRAFDLQELLGKQKQLESRKSNCKELLSISERNINENKNKLSLGSIKKELEKKKMALEKKSDNLKYELGDAEKLWHHAESILALERTIKGFEEERKGLIKGQACGLCGSTEHPYVEKYVKIELTESQRLVESRKHRLESLKKEEKEIALEMAKITTRIEENAAQEKSVEQQIEEAHSAFRKRTSDYSIEEPEPIKITGREMEEELGVLGDKINKTQRLQKEKQEKDGLHNACKDGVNDLKVEIERLQEEIRGHRTVLGRSRKVKEKLEQETEEITMYMEKELFGFELFIPATENTHKFIHQLKNKISVFEHKREERLKVKNEISQLESDIAHLKNQTADRVNTKKRGEADIRKHHEEQSQLRRQRNAMLPMSIKTQQKREELQAGVKMAKQELEESTHNYYALKTDRVTKEKEQGNLKRELETELAELKTCIERLASERKGFGSRQEIASALLSFDDKTKYAGIRKKLNDREVELNTRAEQLKEKRSQQEGDKDLEISPDEARQKHGEMESSKEELLKRSGAIKKQLELDTKIRERNKGVFENITRQEKALKIWTDLWSLLGGSKHAFNTYVQRLTLQNLIQLANLHLYKLNKRYSLKMNESYKTGEELNFDLVDHYQAGEARLVDTSSGGEKFLISLALALGLSDLASNNVSIKSLFIDEGFGTLDNNMLETVISTLETLQAQGKMIGVISHVESLQERISTQIQVLKKSNGVSRIEII